jgi:hypothetical protein
MIFSITKGDGTGALAVRGEPKTQRCSLDLHPDMAPGVACSPLEQKHRVIFLKGASTTKLIPVDFLEHRDEAAVAQDPLGILAVGRTPGFDLL